jgi:hypothetical protein
MARWISRWKVESSSGEGTYTVSQAEDGSFGCSCPQWRFRKQLVCKHIVEVRAMLVREELKMVREVERQAARDQEPGGLRRLRFSQLVLVGLAYCPAFSRARLFLVPAETIQR